MKILNFNHRCPTYEEYQELRIAVGWPKTQKETTEIGLKNSLFSVCVEHNNEVVAVGRVVGDDGIYFYIQDVIVKPNYQAKGIGKKIMELIFRYIDSKAQAGAFVGIMSANGKSNFYEKFGFVPRPNDAPGMFLLQK